MLFGAVDGRPDALHERPFNEAGITLGHLEQEADQLCPGQPGLFAELGQPVAEGRRDGHVEVPTPTHTACHIRAVRPPI